MQPYYPSTHMQYPAPAMPAYPNPNMMFPPAANPGLLYSQYRKAKKNAQSRARAAKLRDRIEMMRQRPQESLTDEERQLLESYEDRRRRKNQRSRERAIEKKLQLESILSKPDKSRSQDEDDTLKIAMNAKKRKNEGDRLRREKIKMAQLAAGGGSVNARGRPRKNNLVFPPSAPQPQQPMTDMYGNPTNPYYGAPVGQAMPTNASHPPTPYHPSVMYNPPDPNANLANSFTNSQVRPSSQQPPVVHGAGSGAGAVGQQVTSQQHEDGSMSINIFGGGSAPIQNSINGVPATAGGGSVSNLPASNNVSTTNDDQMPQMMTGAV